MDWKEALRDLHEFLDIHLFDIASTPITLATLIVFLVIVLLTWGLGYLAQKAAVRLFTARGLSDEGTAAATARLARYVVLLIGFGVAVHSLGINLTALFAAGAVFAVALGFAMQNITQNFVSGMILLLERAIKPGDVLEVDGSMVRVQDMGIRATVAKTLDDEDLVIPNTLLVGATVKNFTFRDAEIRLRAAVGVSYGEDMRAVRRALEEAAAGLDWRRPEREPRVLMTAFGSSSVDFEVSVWFDQPWRLRQRQSELNEAIWWALKDAGITIAFPQMDVHFDAAVTEPLTALRKVE